MKRAAGALLAFAVLLVLICCLIDAVSTPADARGGISAHISAHGEGGFHATEESEGHTTTVHPYYLIAHGSSTEGICSKGIDSVAAASEGQDMVKCKITDDKAAMIWILGGIVMAVLAIAYAVTMP